MQTHKFHSGLPYEISLFRAVVFFVGLSMPIIASALCTNMPIVTADSNLDAAYNIAAADLDGDNDIDIAAVASDDGGGGAQALV